MVVERSATATVNDRNNMHIFFIGVGQNSLRGTSVLALLLVEVEDVMVSLCYDTRRLVHAIVACMQ
jgi:hypothetical protein